MWKPITQIFKILSFDTIPEKIGLYINDQNETKFWNGVEWFNLSLALTKYINADNGSDLLVPTENAVIEYFNNFVSRVSNQIYVELIDIKAETNAENYSWTNDILTITHNLNKMFPSILIFKKVNKTYVSVNLEYTIISSNKIQLDCSTLSNEILAIKVF